MKDFSAGPVPPWASEQIGNPDDFERFEISVWVTPYALSLGPDGFRWWLDRELDGLRHSVINAYFDQRQA